MQFILVCVQVQLGEQIDSKSLIGTYCSTEIPGRFVWRPGPLTVAATRGQVCMRYSIALSDAN